jgi:hypothetical protein
LKLIQSQRDADALSDYQNGLKTSIPVMDFMPSRSPISALCK